MAKEIWLGPVLGTHRERLVARCREYLTKNQANQLLYLAASHPLLDLVTEKLLDGKNAAGVWGEFPVYLFRGFVGRVLSSAVGSEARPSGRATQTKEPSLTLGRLTREPVKRVPIDREELPLRRSLISQIIKQLSATGQLKAIRPLANRDGCVNTIATLIGELQRAGKTAEEFHQAIQDRQTDAQVQSPKPKDQSPKSQLDFDRELALIYARYSTALELHGLTDADADQLRALQILRAESDVQAQWLDQIDLLVLDGFFDFTPVQGEILKSLIPLVPNVIVNVNYDEQNADIFRPFQSTIEHLKSIAPFEIKTSSQSAAVNQSLAPLRERLFNVTRGNIPTVPDNVDDRQDVGEPQARMPALQLIECADREIEIRAIAKEIKRLVLSEGYELANIALVVRERAAYADTILRVFAEESVPCNLERRVEGWDIPAVRACGKLFQLLKETPEHVRNPKASDLAHLIKTDYFRLSDDSLAEVANQFDQKYRRLLNGSQPDQRSNKLREALGIGRWRPDDLENVIAYVGSELRVDAWVERAQKLIKKFPSPEAAQSLIAGQETEDPAATAEDEAPPEDGAAMDRRKKPTPIHPATIAWTALVMRRLQQLLSTVPEQGSVDELRNGLLRLLDQLQFSSQVSVPFARKPGVRDLPQATLDVRGREALRRAIVAAVRSFIYASDVAALANSASFNKKEQELFTPGLTAQITLTAFIDELERCLRAQTLTIGSANRDGLRVLEATDVRGLRFRAIFIAGMIEGGFPLRTSRDWLYPQEERVRLQKHGIFLEDLSTDTLLKEEHYFYQAACRATKRLYLTRPLALNDGTETVPSYYVEEIKRAIAPVAIEIKQIRGDIDGRQFLDVSTPAELAVNLIRRSASQTRRSNSPALSDSLNQRLLAAAQSQNHISESAIRRAEIEHERNGAWFGRYDGEITNADLRKMLEHHFGPDHVYSASRLSTFGNCSFRFFANRVLKVEPRSEAALDLQAIDAGKLLHDILRRFFEKHRGDYLPSLDREALRREMAATADDVFRDYEDKVPPLNDRIWKIDCEIRKLILDQVLLYEIRLQEKVSGRNLRPAYFELAFGRSAPGSDPNSTTQFLKLERHQQAGDVALIQGQIDRVDVSQTGRVAVAYDYKLSAGARLDDINSGRQVQIPIYLAALEQLFLPGFQLGGGGYYTLRGKPPRLNRGLYRLAFADCTTVTNPRAKLSDDEWQRVRRDVEQRIWEFIDGMRGGHFRVKPSLGRLSCKYCDYSAVCRYDAYRIGRKKGD